VIAFNKHSIQESEQFKAIMEKAQAHVQTIMQQAAQQMQQAQAQAR